MIVAIAAHNVVCSSSGISPKRCLSHKVTGFLTTTATGTSRTRWLNEFRRCCETIEKAEEPFKSLHASASQQDATTQCHVCIPTQHGMKCVLHAHWCFVVFGICILRQNCPTGAILVVYVFSHLSAGFDGHAAESTVPMQPSLVRRHSEIQHHAV